MKVFENALYSQNSKGLVLTLQTILHFEADDMQGSKNPN
jgi:hypothetical protein